MPRSLNIAVAALGDLMRHRTLRPIYHIDGYAERCSVAERDILIVETLKSFQGSGTGTNRKLSSSVKSRVCSLYTTVPLQVGSEGVEPSLHGLKVQSASITPRSH